MNGVDPEYTEDFDVCIIGAGPVGAYLTVRLAREGLRVAIFDALFTLADEPRAVVHMPILFQEYEDADILQRMKELSKVHSGAISYRRTRDAQVIEKIQPNPKRPGPLTVPQPIFTQLLLDKLESLPNAKLSLGHKFIELEERADGIDLKIEDIRGTAIRRIRCQYLIGADGSKSAVRKAIGTNYQGSTLPYKLIAADVIFPFEKYGYDGANYMLDPEDFGLIALISTTEDGRTVWRVSVTFPIAMSDDEIMQALPDKFEKLCKELKPGTYEILVAKPYPAHQFSTSTMMKGRTLLVGDAAHLSNPYAGQSMASGIFDVSSLADCLLPILKRGAPTSLLEEWNQERLLKSEKILHPLSMTCFNAVRDPDVETIGQRFPFLIAMKAGPAAMASMPTLRTDVTKFKSWQTDKVPEPIQNGSNGEKVDLIWTS